MHNKFRVILYVLIINIITVFLFAGCNSTSQGIREPKNNISIPQDESTNLSTMNNSTNTNGSLTPSAAVPPVQWKGTTDKKIYSPGEIVNINFSISNNYYETVKLEQYQPEIKIKKHNPQSRIDTIRTLLNKNIATSISKGSTVNYEIAWDQKYDNGKPADVGWYDVQIRVTSSGINLQGGLDKFLIFPKDEQLNKIIEPNQSVIVRNIIINPIKGITTEVTMNLQRIEFNDEGIVIVVFASSPAYSLGPKGLWDVYPPDFNNIPKAEYSIDGVTNLAGDAVFQAKPDGMILKWGEMEYSQLDPVYKNAKDFIFNIKSWGDWEGPWQFHVPLNHENTK